MTQNRIFASVYCEKQSFQPPRRASAVLAAKIEDFRSHSCACTRTIRWHAHLDRNQEEEEEELNEDAGDVFGLEQGDLLLQSEDSTLHLRQLHDQVMVLRSAAFNAMITCAMCLFAWGVRLRCEKPRSVILRCSAAVSLELTSLSLRLPKSGEIQSRIADSLSAR